MSSLKNDWKGGAVTMAEGGALQVDDINLEQVIGTNNMQEPWFLCKGYSVSGPVCLIPRSGTGFLISNNVIMTNWHIFRSKEWARDSVVVFKYENNENGIIVDEETYSLNPDALFYSNKGLDYAVCAVAGDPGKKYGYINISKPGIVKNNMRINIIQHPGAGAKQIAIRENMLSYHDDVFLQYLTDTEHGSSGSPVFNDSWEIVGLHYRHDSAVSVDNSKFYYNEAHRISAVYESLNAVFPDYATA